MRSPLSLVLLVVVAIIVGAVTASGVACMNITTKVLHVALFQSSEGWELSASSAIPKALALFVPLLGGVWVGLLVHTSNKLVKHRIVDPIEANALRGGVMSIFESLIIVAQTVLSNGVGGSIGLEAGYTQFGGATGSWLARRLQLNRSACRLLVGCGAAAAIGAAFDAPLTGAFYAFELILGAYSVALLAPLMLSSFIAVWVASVWLGARYGMSFPISGVTLNANLGGAILVGTVCAGFGFLLMYGVAKTEHAIARKKAPTWLKTGLGGAVIGLLALVTPQVLSSGHSALKLDLPQTITGLTLVALIIFKSAATTVSIATGFRGGLFFASLFLGALIGKLIFQCLLVIGIVSGSDSLFAIVGMSALATAVLGTPLAMTFLALEITGSLPVALIALLASVLASLILQLTFGYSFSTWRFHLRGETIRTAADVGWPHNLTITGLIEKAFSQISAPFGLDELKNKVMQSNSPEFVVTDASGRYLGLVAVLGLLSSNSDTDVASHYMLQGSCLHATSTFAQAREMFERTKSEVLAVTISSADDRVVGVIYRPQLLEAFVEELEKRRRELVGDWSA